MADENYTVYHLHSDSSNANGYADSSTKFQEYVDLAKSQGMTALGFSEHGNIYNWYDKKCACEKVGIKYMHGIEMYLCKKPEDDIRGSHICLYARNFDGFKELNSLWAKSTSRGVREDNKDRYFYYTPRISLADLMSTSDNILITTACISSPLARWVEEDGTWHDEKYELIDWLSLNSDRCFLEIQYHDFDKQIEFNNELYQISQKYNIPLIVGTDTHSSNQYASECRKVLQAGKERYYDENDSLDLTWKTYDELVKKFIEQDCDIPLPEIKNAIQNTNVFADKIEEFEIDLSFKYPNHYGEDASKLWKKHIFNCMKDKLQQGAISKEQFDLYEEQIYTEYEAMAEKQDMSSFMLYNSDFLQRAREQGIPTGAARGSVSGSQIAYQTDITSVDPVVWGTIFSRFVNEDRVSLADIDIDFAPEDREKVYEIIINDFTPEKTAYIVTFQRMSDRGTIDVLAKGLNYKDLDLVERIKDTHQNLMEDYQKVIIEHINIEENNLSISFDNHKSFMKIINSQEARESIHKIKEQFDGLKEEYKDLFYYFDGINGTIISKGLHPAGIIASPITLADNMGVFYYKGDSNTPVSSVCMEQVEAMNYVKIDILGLRTAGIIKDTYNYIGIKPLLSHEIDFDDKKVWDNMIKCRVGVPQFEKESTFKQLQKYRPTSLRDMSLINAAIRPSGASYRDNLINRIPHSNPSAEIDELLKDNNGYLVFQEDTIRFLQEICGLSGGEADTVRRAIGHKDNEAVQEALPRIIDGYCEKSSSPKDVAEEEVREFIQIISDSSEYQFSLNHALAYSMNGYICTMLRTYYPLEFTTAYLNRVEKDKEEQVLLGVELAEFNNIEIKNIAFGKSDAKYTLDKDKNIIYKGLESVKYCNSVIPNELNALHNSLDSEHTFLDVLKGIKTETSVNRRQIDILIRLGYFDKYGSVEYLFSILQLHESILSQGNNYRKQFSKSDIEDDSVFTPKLLGKYGNETEKLYNNIDAFEMAKEVEEGMVDDGSLNIVKRVKDEVEFLGYPDYINAELTYDYFIVTDLRKYRNKGKKELYNIYATLYNIKDGRYLKVRIDTNGYKTYIKPTHYFEEMDLIFELDILVKNRSRRIVDPITSKVTYEQLDSKQNILRNWSIAK